MPDGTAGSAAANLALVGSAIALANLKKRQEDEFAVSMVGIDPDTGETVIPQKSFQWWPETITDNIAIGWQDVQIPAASHAIVHWNSNGGRTITFEIRLTRYLRYPESFKPLGPNVVSRATLGFLVDPDNARNRPYNVDVGGAIAYLRAFCYPEYEESGGLAKPPAIVVMSVDGLGLNEDGGDAIFSVMTACDVTYERTFENGKPRNATVSLAFKQVVQSKDGVRYKRRSDLLSRSNLSDKSGSIDQFNSSRSASDTSRTEP